MKQVRITLARVVQRLVGKLRSVTPAQPAQPLQELDTRVLAQASGGVASETQTPRVGW